MPALLLQPLGDGQDGLAEPTRRTLGVIGWVMGWYLGFLFIIQVLTPSRASDSAQVGMFTLAGFTIVLALVLLDRATRSGRAEAFVLVGVAGLAVPVTVGDWYGDAVTTTMLLGAASVVLALATWRRTPHDGWVAATRSPIAIVPASSSVSRSGGSCAPAASR